MNLCSSFVHRCHFTGVAWSTSTSKKNNNQLCVQKNVGLFTKSLHYDLQHSILTPVFFLR